MAIANLQEVHPDDSRLMTQTHMKIDKSKEKKKKSKQYFAEQFVYHDGVLWIDTFRTAFSGTFSREI